MPPSGHRKNSAPLSLEYMTMVLSSMPSFFNSSSNCRHGIVLNHAVRLDAETGLAFPFGLRCV